MNINVEPVSNGWLVIVKLPIGKNIRKVFIDRQQMLDFINDVVPPTGEESSFIDGIDNDETEDDEVNMSRIEDLMQELDNNTISDKDIYAEKLQPKYFWKEETL